VVSSGKGTHELIDDIARRQLTREIELELIRVRAAAAAARLEARAAELELLLQRMAAGSNYDQSRMSVTGLSAQTELEHAMSALNASQTDASPQGMSSQGISPLGTMAPVTSQQATQQDSTQQQATQQQAIPPNSWSSRVSRMQSRDDAQPLPSVNSFTSVQGRPVDAPTSQDIPLGIPGEQNFVGAWQRSDHGSTPIRAPHFNERAVAVVAKHDQTIAPKAPLVVDHVAGIPSREASVAAEAATTIAAPSFVDTALIKAPLPKPVLKSNAAATVIAPLAPKPKKSTVPLPAIKPIDAEEEAETKRRFRPASFLVSTMAHVVVLILLGIATLATKQPKDQLAFTSSVAESSEETMETFAIESNEPMEETEPVPTESAYEISDVGTIAVTEVSMDLPPAPAPPTTADFLNSSSSSLSSSAMKSLKSDSKMKSQFCGVDGGGSHFVYLVDSSGSMRDGFQSARTELLASIDQLKPDQRFYVVFFDEDPDYMRISDSNADESGSVMATPENKQRLRKWAMTVEMNRGKAPYDILPFALTLRPDVIFLLSDGEFPVKIEEILQVQNRQENLFGESGPISIVHTIRYHGIEGETGRKAEDTMIKIAKENGGQYRHVPKPK